MEFLRNSVNDAISHVVATIVEHASYYFHVNKNITELVSATENLAALKEDVKTNIINAEREYCAPTKQVEKWLNKVEAIEKEAEEIPKVYHKRRRSILSDYITSRSAVKKLREGKSLCDQRTTVKDIIPMPPPLAQEMPASSSKSVNLDLALQYIKDDVLGIIGIYGMGGVGKTHLLKQINNNLCKHSSISVVIFITCSKECSEEKIQDEIIDRLGLKKSNSMEQKQATLFNFLKERSFVLLLDDLWRRIDLEIVGIPIPLDLTGTNKRKIVLTTRSTDVCGQMEVKKRIKVEVLNWDEAWNLFKKKATEETIVSHPIIKKNAVEVVRKLGGLPLALIIIGRAMCDKRDPSEWEHAVKLLKRARLNDVELSGADETVFEVLKFSYDKLRSDNLKECFLHCSLWPEDYEIEKDELVELWLGLGLIDEPDVNMAYYTGYSNINWLQAVCLLETTNKESRVKLHDVIRDMSLWIASNQMMEKYKWIVGSRLSEIVIRKETEKISLMNHNGSFSFSNTSHDCNKVTTLLFIPGNLSNMKLLPIQTFPNLTVLNLRGNRLAVFPTEICSLRSLQFIDLSGNEIKSLPNELAHLTNLKYLILRWNIICIVPVGAICKMKSLQIVDLTRRFGFYKKVYQIKSDFVPALLEELHSLNKVGAIGIEINDVMQFRKLTELSNLPIRWLTITIWEELRTFPFFCSFLQTYMSRSSLVSLRITNMVVEKLEFERTCKKPCSCGLRRVEDLHIFDCRMKEIAWKGLDPRDLFPWLRHLTIHACDYLTSISWVVQLPCLQELKVIGCRGIKQMFNGNKQLVPTFPFLKLLEVRHLVMLESFCDQQISFPALESLTILWCKRLKKLPFRADNIPRKLNCIRVNEEWWSGLEWDEGYRKASFSGLVRFVL